MRVKEALMDEQLEHEEHVALEGLHIWGCLNTVAQTIVNEVLSTHKSETLDELYVLIRKFYNEQQR